MCYNAACVQYNSYGQESCIRYGVLKVAPFDGLIFIYQTDPVGYASKRVFFFVDFELYELYYASYLCRGIGQTSCSFEHVSCLTYYLMTLERVCKFNREQQPTYYVARFSLSEFVMGMRLNCLLKLSLHRSMGQCMSLYYTNIIVSLLTYVCFRLSLGPILLYYAWHMNAKEGSYDANTNCSY